MEHIRRRACSTAFSTAVSATLLTAALGFALPAAAQMYKWTDDRGQVSYSNTPPPVSAQARKIGVIEDRVSVYTPDELTTRAMAEDAAGTRSDRRQRESKPGPVTRTGRQGEPYDQDRQARLKAAYDRCVADRRVECESILSGRPSDASTGYNSYYGPQYVIGSRVLPPPPFYVDPTPPPRVGVSTAPKAGIDDRPPVGLPPRTRPIGSSR